MAVWLTAFSGCLWWGGKRFLALKCPNSGSSALRLLLRLDMIAWIHCSPTVTKDNFELTEEHTVWPHSLFFVAFTISLMESTPQSTIPPLDHFCFCIPPASKNFEPTSAWCPRLTRPRYLRATYKRAMSTPNTRSSTLGTTDCPWMANTTLGVSKLVVMMLKSMLCAVNIGLRSESGIFVVWFTLFIVDSAHR